MESTTAPPRLFTPAAGPPSRRALELAWLAYLVAVRSGRESELQQTMSSFHFTTTRNDTARAGRTLTPEYLGPRRRFLPDLGTTTFVTVIENDPTAALVHARDDRQGDPGSEPRVEYFCFRFVDGGRGWKLDGVATINSPKYRADGSPAPLRLRAGPSPLYRIAGRLRPAPAPVPVAR